MKPQNRTLFSEYSESKYSCQNRAIGIKRTMKHKANKVSRREARKEIRNEILECSF